MKLTDDLGKLYDKCCEGYHKVDDFRSKLLGFLPLASGIAIVGSLFIEEKPGNKFILNNQNIALGIFGMVVTFGLLIYELKGIEKCTQFIKLGKWLESQMEINTETGEKLVEKGFFTELVYGNKYVNEPIATAIIYSIVLSLWTYVVLLGLFRENHYVIPVIIILIIFSSSFILVYKYWQKIIRKNGFKDLKRSDDAYK